MNHHWLSEVFLYLLHRVAGVNGLIVWKMLMMGGAMALAMLAVRPKRFSVLHWTAGILAAVMLGFRAHIRPELFTYLFVAIFLFLFERIRAGSRWPRWALLGLALLWANLHIYFVFGIGMAFAFAAERSFKVQGSRFKVESSAFLREAAWVAAIVAVSCFNPNGVRGLLYPLNIFANYEVGITENMSPLGYWRTVLNPMLLALPLMTVLVVAAMIASWRRYVSSGGIEPLRLANILIAAVAVLATWKMARSAPLLALAALPLVAATGKPKSKVQGPEFQVSGFRFRVFTRIACSVLVLLNVSLCYAVIEGSYSRVFPSPIGPTSFGFDHEERYERLRHLAQDYGLKGPLFTDYNFGSLVEYQLYPEPGYVDNRPEAFPGAFWRTEYTPALALTERWAQVRDERDVNAIIVSLPGVKEAFTQELMRRPFWVLVYLDDLCGVWVRNDIRNKRIIDALLFNMERRDVYEQDIARRLKELPDVPWWRAQVEAERLAYHLYSLVCISEGARAWPYLKQLHQQYPDYQIVHELMRVTVPPDETQFVDRILERHAGRPVAAKQVLDWAYCLVDRGDLKEAKKVIRRGRLLFPLSSELQKAKATVEDLEYREAGGVT